MANCQVEEDKGFPGDKGFTDFACAPQAFRKKLAAPRKQRSTGPDSVPFKREGGSVALRSSRKYQQLSTTVNDPGERGLAGW